MDVLFLLGAGQGLFLALVLATRPHNLLPNRLLAALVLVFSADLAMAVYHSTEASVRHPALIGLDMPIAFLYGPLLYLYVRTLTSERPALRRSDAAHFAPFGLLVLFLLPFFARPGADKLMLMHFPERAFQTQAMGSVNPFKLLHGGVYLGLVGLRLRRHQRRIRDTFSALEHRTLRWLRNLTLGMGVLLLLTGLLYALGGATLTPIVGMNPNDLYDDLTLLGVTVFVYALGYFGLRQPEVMALPERHTVAPEQVEAPKPDAPLVEQARYARSGMGADEAQQHRDRLVALMETEPLYRRGDLTLQDLADAVGISAHNLTEVLNTQLGQSFYDFVNGYRVREVQARLTDPAFANWTVLAIGMEAGFNAKSSFNTAFKRLTGMSPSQYRQQGKHESTSSG